MNTEEILSLKIEHPADSEKQITLKAYLILLLETLWLEGEGFSGKRPFGNSGWQYDVYKVLILEKIISGSIDEHGYIVACNTDEAEQFVVNKLIAALRQ